MEQDNSVQQQDIDELITLIAQAQRATVKKLLEKDLAQLKVAFTASESTNVSQTSPVIPTQTQSPVPAPIKISTAESTVEYATLNQYSWEQTDTNAKLYVEIEGIGSLPKDAVEVTFKNTGVEMKVHNLNGKNYKFSLSNLAKQIDTTACTYSLKPKRAIITLKKKASGHWDSIFHKEDMLKKPKGKEPADPSKGLMDMMKNLYENGDEETKKMIAKTWTESREKKDSKFGEL